MNRQQIGLCNHCGKFFTFTYRGGRKQSYCNKECKLEFNRNNRLRKLFETILAKSKIKDK